MNSIDFVVVLPEMMLEFRQKGGGMTNYAESEKQAAGTGTVIGEGVCSRIGRISLGLHLVGVSTKYMDRTKSGPSL